MKNHILRIRAVAKAEFLLRFRRSSTIVIFLLLCLMAYTWIPAPSTGRALLQIGEQRALYNSSALAMATASLCTILLGLVGFYMISNAVKRDIQTRTGFIIASTVVSNIDYLAGKFFGNFLFLGSLVTGFMFSSMAMQLVRGEASLKPWVFFWHYILLVPPMLVFLSAVAIFFESVRFLSGRFGDVVYFFVWTATVAVQAALPSSDAAYFDPMGFAFLLDGIKAATGTTHVSIGMSSYDMTKPPIEIPGLSLPVEWLFPRLSSLLFALPLVFLGSLFFHRFNPVKLKAAHQKSSQNLLRWINTILKPVTTPLFLLAQRLLPSNGIQESTVWRSVAAETALAFKLYPIATLFLLVSVPVSLFSPIHFLQKSWLPLLFAFLAVATSDLSTRERQQGTSSMIVALPYLKANFVWWKLASTILLALSFTLVPAIRLSLFDLSSGLSLLIGTLFLAACATSLGILSGNPKTMIVLFFLFLYVVLNDPKSAAVDFAGWNGAATPGVQLSYIAISVAMLVSAHLTYRWQLRRNF